jgi:hypothetical protein
MLAETPVRTRGSDEIPESTEQRSWSIAGFALEISFWIARPTRRQIISWTTFLKSHFDVFRESGLDTLTLWFCELIKYVMEPVWCDNAIVGNAVEANNDAISSLVILSFPIRPVTVSTTQSSRGPPAVVHLAISHRKFRHAA